MNIHFPNSAHLQNLQGFLKRCSFENLHEFDFSMHEKWVSVHPVVLAMTACAAAAVQERRGDIDGETHAHAALAYLIRMGLFKYLAIDPGKTITSHEAAGRFIPLTQIRNSGQLSSAITDLVPLLHARPDEQDSVRYVFSELVRNALEHSESTVGAFLCAQYYKDSNRISIGIADAGIGIRRSITRSHTAPTTRDAIALALQPGITGTTPRLGGSIANAGAGLFFVKSIAALSRNFFVLYSDDTMFKLLRRRRGVVPLHANPERDRHTFVTGLPAWPGTVVGIDLTMRAGQQLTNFLAAIKEAYRTETTSKKKREYFKQIRFST